MSEYGHHAIFPTRWNDNDQYGHVNNAVYYEAMDTTINTWLIANGLTPVGGDHIAVCASSACEYRASVAFPDAMRVGLRAGRLGTTSVTWELAIHRLANPGLGDSPDGPNGKTVRNGETVGDGKTMRNGATIGNDRSEPEPVATGRFVHVFVDARTRRPVPVPPGLRTAIERDLVI
jgi:acyl-CoA thioester hydrolase